MAFKPLNTMDATTAFYKTLVLASHGWGKTTQAKHYKARYGKGFIISGESGLSSIRSQGIDYLPFSSFDGAVDQAKGIYSFTEICRMIMSDEFKAEGYKWIMLDSLTELSGLTFAWADAKATAEAAMLNKKVNGFDKWGSYSESMINACKFIRDLPYHVCITSLVKSGEDDNGAVFHQPLLQGSAVQAQIPGIFDNVLCGVTATVKDAAGEDAIERYVVTAELRGWKGKVRDELGVVLPVEKTGDVTTILEKMTVV
jgi:hypothetical protein